MSNPSDVCVFNKIGASGQQISLYVYIDDIQVTGESEDIEDIA
jgi:hypothetical protein